jgi:hypothetical protein
MKHSFLFIAAAVLATGCVNIETHKSSASTIPTAKAPVASAPAVTAAGKVDAEGFTTIFDGDWTNWRVNENPKAWSIVNGALRACGDRSHCFYYGPLAPFKDFELKLDIKTEPGSNGGVYIHTRYLDSGWPIGGYETQVNQTQGDWRKSGSVYAVQDVKEDVIKGLVKDNEWYTHHVVVKGKNIKIYLNGKLVNDFTEEPGRQPGKDFERILNQGTVALQAHDPKSVVLYKNIRVKKL